MQVERSREVHDPRTCQDCVGIGRAWIEGMLQDCPECGGSGWESAIGVPSRLGLRTVPLPAPDLVTVRVRVVGAAVKFAVALRFWVTVRVIGLGMPVNGAAQPEKV